MKAFILYIMIFSSLNLFSQVVKGISYNTQITASGIAEGGTRTTTTIVITCKSKNVQISNLLPETSSLYKELRLNEFDTLTIIFITYISHLNSFESKIDKDNYMPEPTFKKEGYQKHISFNYHPVEFDLYTTEETYYPEYICQGNTHKVLLPKHVVKENMMP